MHTLPESGTDQRAIEALLERYFDGLYYCDSARLRAVLHPVALYATASDGGLLTMDMPTYWGVVDRRISPAQQGQARKDRIRTIEVIGGDTAVARVQCTAHPRAFDDVLSLLKLEGRWWIVAKVFHFDLLAMESA